MPLPPSRRQCLLRQLRDVLDCALAGPAELPALLELRLQELARTLFGGQPLTRAPNGMRSGEPAINDPFLGARGRLLDTGGGERR